MESWLYRIKELWILHKREIIRYSVCAWFVIIGVATAWWPGAWGGLVAAALIYAFDRWGRPFAERGRTILGQNAPKDKAS